MPEGHPELPDEGLPDELGDDLELDDVEDTSDEPEE